MRLNGIIIVYQCHESTDSTSIHLKIDPEPSGMSLYLPSDGRGGADLTPVISETER